jgi:hypothetical protein
MLVDALSDDGLILGGGPLGEWEERFLLSATYYGATSNSSPLSGYYASGSQATEGVRATSTRKADAVSVAYLWPPASPERANTCAQRSCLLLHCPLTPRPVRCGGR